MISLQALLQAPLSCSTAQLQRRRSRQSTVSIQLKIINESLYIVVVVTSTIDVELVHIYSPYFGGCPASRSHLLMSNFSLLLP